MRKWLCCLTLLLVFSSWSYAEEQVLDVSVYKQGFVLNGIALNSSTIQHPLLFYKEVVYLPLSTEMGVQAGFTTTWSEEKKTLNIQPTAPKTAALPANAFGHPERVQVRITGNPVTLADEPVPLGDYPALIYQDVTYLPMTWNMINTQLKWKSAHHAFLGLIIQSDGQKSIEDVLGAYNLKYYEALAAFIQTRNSGYSSESALATVKMIKENADIQAIDEKWIMALWWKESNFNSSSISSHGALGAMQIMPGTGQRLGYTREQLLDPKYNVEGGTRYLANLRKTFNGDMFLAVSAYNQGSGAVSRGSFNRSFGTDVQKKFDIIDAYVKNRLAQ